MRAARASVLYFAIVFTWAFALGVLRTLIVAPRTGALLGDGRRSVSLDKVIAAMRRTGEDMSAIHKETSLGGLAVNLAEC